MLLIHTDIHNSFGRHHENGSTEQEKAELTALPFFYLIQYHNLVAEKGVSCISEFDFHCSYLILSRFVN